MDARFFQPTLSRQAQACEAEMNFEQMQNRIASLCEANEIVYQFNDGKEPDGAWGSYYLRRSRSRQ
jgi:hypothetical protein